MYRLEHTNELDSKINALMNQARKKIAASREPLNEGQQDEPLVNQNQ